MPPVSAVVTPKSTLSAPSSTERASIAGTVSDDAHEPIPHARVCVRTESPELPRAETRAPHCTNADAHGAYAIGELFAAEYDVSALAEHHRPGHVDHFALHAGEQRAGVDLVLRAGGVEITGTVSDLSGGPIAHADVAACPTTTYASSATVETDDAGAFRLWVAPGSIGVSAEAEGYAADIAWGTAPGTFELVLTPESTLAGTVVDARTHEPVAGATVTLSREGGRIGGGGNDITDEHGGFRFDRLGPDRYSEHAIATRGFGRSDGSVAVGLGQHVDGGVVELQPAARVAGTVLIAGTPDKPCPKPSLDLWADDEEASRTAHADVDGSVRADGVVAGSYRVVVGCDGYVLAGTAPTLEVGDRDITGLTWRMVREPASATIRGHVRTRAGVAVAGAIVSSYGRHATSSADGSYELRALDAGAQRIEVQSEDGIAPERGWELEVTVGAVVVQELTLDPGGSIAGTVVDSDGKPAARVSVTIMYPNYLRADSGADGTFRFTNLRPGMYTVDAVQADGQITSEHVTVRASQTSNVKLVIAVAPGSISGLVVDAAGSPFGDAFVVAAHEIEGYANTRPWSPNHGSQVLAGIDGTFTIAHLVPGSYTLRAYRTGGGETILEHVLVGSHVRLQITPTGSIAGTVHAPTGAAIDVTVRVAGTHSGFSQAERFYRTEGRYHLDDLPAGEYRITASVAGIEGQSDVTLAEGAHLTRVDVAIEGITLVGRLVDLDSKQPVAGVEVRASLVGGWATHTAQTDRDGRFTIADAPRGPLLLRLGVGPDAAYQEDYFERAVTGSGTVDLGDLTVIKVRVKRGDPVGFLGIQFADHSMRVARIAAGSPAAKTELAVGDVITAINGTGVTAIEGGVAQALLAAPPGTTFQLGLARATTITLVTAIAEPQ